MEQKPAASADDDLFDIDDSAKPEASAPESDEISEDEFEALLDQLHGSGKAPTKNQAPPPPKAEPPAAAAGGDLITDSEFEDLLDQLHGAGKGPTVDSKPAETTSSTTPSTAASTAFCTTSCCCISLIKFNFKVD